MKVTKVYPNGNFHIEEIKHYKDGDIKCEFDVYQVIGHKDVKVNDEIEFTDYRFKQEKFKDENGKLSSKIVILSMGIKEIKND